MQVSGMNLASRLDRITARAEELRAMLSEGMSGDAYVRASKELAEIEPLVARVGDLRAAERAQAEAETLLADPEMHELAETELRDLKEQIPGLQHEIRLALLPKDAADERCRHPGSAPRCRRRRGRAVRHRTVRDVPALCRSAWLAVRDPGIHRHRAGRPEGGHRRDQRPRRLRPAEIRSGVHRVQRVPTTESQGRIHTSTVTVAVLPEAEEVDVQVDEGDLRIDVYRASGAGGQHVNKTESAVRITHLPSGIVVAMQEEKSQHKNRAKAMKILRARLYEQQRASLHATRAADRKAQVGTGRSAASGSAPYNFPQGRVTDHRINLTLYKIDRVMAGELDEFIDALTAEDQAARLAAEE